MKSSDILLVVPPSRSYTQRLPIGLMSISSYLSSKGMENEILDFKAISPKDAYAKIKKKVIESQPKYVGITCLVSEVGIVRDICSFIRNNSKETKIIIGGPHPSICPGHFTDLEVDFDYLVIGEGEYTFKELIETLEKKDSAKLMPHVKGIAYHDKKNPKKLAFNAPRELIQNLDDLPFPAYDKVDMEYYCRPNAWTIRPVYLSSFNILTSRGCPYSCNFCVAHTIFGRRVRFISPEKTVDHIEHIIKKYKVDAIYFNDESFTVSKERVYKIFNLLKQRKIKILFGCQTRINLLDEELLKFMKKNGCIQIDLGIESGSEKVLDIIHKQVKVADMIKIGEICNKIGMRQLANMLVNVPGETLEDVEKSLQLVKKLKYNVVLWNTYTPFPGVNFGSELELEDLDTLLKYPSKETFELLEKKYKFSEYKKSLLEVLDHLYSQTFHPKYIKLTLSPSYWLSAFRLFSFVFDYRYLLQLAKSKRKLQYITNLISQKVNA